MTALLAKLPKTSARGLLHMQWTWRLLPGGPCSPEGYFTSWIMWNVGKS